MDIFGHVLLGTRGTSIIATSATQEIIVILLSDLVIEKLARRAKRRNTSRPIRCTEAPTWRKIYTVLIRKTTRARAL